MEFLQIIQPIQFISLDFVVFFTLASLLYFAIPARFRWAFLLIASYLFYLTWKPGWLLLLLGATVVVYGAALLMQNASPRMKRFWLAASLVINLGMLFVFKYYNFFQGSLVSLAQVMGITYNPPMLSLMLPIGLSFYTLQSLTYSIDVYRGSRPAEKNFGIVALFVSFFPLILMGPIERSTTLMPQFFQKKEFDGERVVRGLMLMGWGYVQKLIIADRLAPYVFAVYDAQGALDPSHPLHVTGLPLLIATYFFAFQILCDFAGYSDIAIGAAQVMGFDVMVNFRRPFFARSIGELWRRWHISLISWLRDYLYIPLGGSRVAQWRGYFNIMVVFTLSGLWHGASWNFVSWGALNGVLISLGRLTEDARARVRDAIIGALKAIPWPGSSAAKIHRGIDGGIALWQVLVTFHLFVLGAVFFRARTMTDAWYVITHLWEKSKFPAKLVFTNDAFMGMILSLVALNAVNLLQERGNVRDMILRRPLVQRWLIYYAFFIILFLTMYNTTQFIYFVF